MIHTLENRMTDSELLLRLIDEVPEERNGDG
jgi:hypothetical protein